MCMSRSVRPTFDRILSQVINVVKIGVKSGEFAARTGSKHQKVRGVVHIGTKFQNSSIELPLMVGCVQTDRVIRTVLQATPSSASPTLQQAFKQACHWFHTPRKSASSAARDKADNSMDARDWSPEEAKKTLL